MTEMRAADYEFELGRYDANLGRVASHADNADYMAGFFMVLFQERKRHQRKRLQ